MPVVNLTNPLVTALCLAVLVCLIFLGHEIKRSLPTAIGLGLCIGLLITHALQLYVFKNAYEAYVIQLSSSIIYDFAFILVSYLGYLWIDDIEARARNKKSIDNSLDWFWKKI